MTFRILPLLLCVSALSALDDFHRSLLDELAPAGSGSSLLAATESAALERWRGRRAGSLRIEAVEGQPFTTAMTLHTAEKMQSYYEDGADSSLPSAVSKGDLVYVTLSARSLASSLESGESLCYLVVKGGKGKGELRKHFLVGPDWQRFSWRFHAGQDYAPGKLQLHLWTGDQAQTMQIGGLAFVGLGPDGDPAALPTTRLALDYEGRAADAPWRAEAAERIARLRTGSLDIRVVDAAGAPVPGARVQATLDRHAFHFGMTVVGHQLADDPGYRERVAGLVERLGLNSLVFANDLKPGLWRGHGAFSAEKTLRALEWVEAQGLRTRGHTLLWGPRYLSKPQQEWLAAGDTAALQTSLLAHIADCVGRTAPFVDAWDVHNEHFTYRDLTTVLGAEAAAEWFRAAHAANPDALLFWNENCILSRAPQTALKTADALEWIARLRELGAPLGGMGMQSHMGMSATPPSELWRRLDRFAALGVAIESTEFDVAVQDPSDPEQQAFQRDYVRDFLTALFAHQAVIGINHWSPIKGEAYTESGCLVADGDRLLPSGEAWIDLVRREWWTDEALDTDRDGRATLRGYRGRYRLSAQADGRRLELEASIGERPGELVITLP